jgi:hypothetical protein
MASVASQQAYSRIYNAQKHQNAGILSETTRLDYWIYVSFDRRCLAGGWHSARPVNRAGVLFDLMLDPSLTKQAQYQQLQFLCCPDRSSIGVGGVDV